MAEMRTCRIEGCTRQHKRIYFCCRVHWFSLPKHYRDEIYRTHDRGQGTFSNEYMQACENAEAHLEDRDAEEIDVFA